MEKLSRIIRPVAKRPIKIVQFGEGNFLRAFVDPFIQTLNEKGLFNGNVAVVQPMPFGRVKDLKEQDGLYTLILEGIENKQVVSQSRLIDVISDFYDPYQDFRAYLDLSASKDITTIISNTTEAGIVYLEEQVGFDKTPISFPGKLLAFLMKRYEVFRGNIAAGLDILACELIDNNGTELKKVLLKLANYNQCDDGFIQWLDKHNRFYNTLVDRIVPGYPHQDVLKLQSEFGYIDHSKFKSEI